MGGCFISEFLKNHNRRLTTSQITTKHWFGVRTGVGWFLDRGIGICRLSAWAYTHWFSKVQITNFGIWPWFSKIKITKCGIWPWFLAIQITNFDIWPWFSKLCKSKKKTSQRTVSSLPILSWNLLIFKKGFWNNWNWWVFDFLQRNPKRRFFDSGICNKPELMILFKNSN